MDSRPKNMPWRKHDIVQSKSSCFCTVYACKAYQAWHQSFALCCAVTGFLLSFKIYTGAADESSYTLNWDLIHKLIVAAGLTSAYSCILYTGQLHKRFVICGSSCLKINMIGETLIFQDSGPGLSPIRPLHDHLCWCEIRIIEKWIQMAISCLILTVWHLKFLMRKRSI